MRGRKSSCARAGIIGRGWKMDYRRPHTHIKALESYNAISSVLYVYRNNGCSKTELYHAVSKAAGMVDKVKDLEDAGLISHVTAGRVTRLYMTELGAEVGRRLAEIEELMAD